MENDNYLAEGFFKFPFKPYRIQEDFMRNLYRTIDCGKIGIFESPTGTVSLSSTIINSSCVDHINIKNSTELN